MSNKTKIVSVIEFNAETQNLKKALNELQSSFSGMELPSNILNMFTKLEHSLDLILSKTAKGVISREDFASAEKEAKKVKTQFDNLAVTLGTVYSASDKKLASMIPAETRQQIEEVNKAYQEYVNILSDVAAAEKAYEEAKQRQKDKEDVLKQKTGSERAYKGQVTKAQNQLKEYQDVVDAIQEREAAVKALTKAQKDYDKAVSEGAGEKSRDNKKQKLDAATARKVKADEAIKDIEPQRIIETEALIKKLSEAEEKLSYSVKQTAAAEKAKLEIDVEVQQAAKQLANEKEKQLKREEEEALALQNLTTALSTLNPKFKDLDLAGKTSSEKLEFLKQVVGSLTKEELERLKTTLEQSGVPLNEVKSALDMVNKALNDTKEATEASDKALGQDEAIKNKIKAFLGLSGAAKVLRSALRNAFQTIKELDATMTQMAVVTDLDVGDYWDQLPQYTERAKELGLAIEDVYKADTLFYQQGLKTNEVIEISTETMKMAAIAGLDTATATDRMTAALRGFNMELNETSAQRVSDVYSELAAITAADVKEISSAMTKTASIASSAGMEFETTAAFLSQIIETTRESAETAGTAMKTIVARFQELKKDPAEIGEVDGEIVDANQIETALRSVGVALRDSSGQFRELDEVFLELSSKWGSLDKNTQRYIATIAAGSRQQSRFIAMMSDYGRTQELVDAATTSSGASQKQFEKTTESLAFKINKLKDAWSEFTMGIMNSDLVKFGVEVLTTFLEVVNKATSALDGIGGSLVKIISVVGIFKMGKAIFDKFANPIASFFVNLTKQTYEAGVKGAKAYQSGLKAGAKNEGDKKDGSKKKKRTKKQKLGDIAVGLDKWQEGNEYGEERKKAKEELKGLTKDTEQYEKAHEKALTASENQWKSYGAAITQTGMAISGVGVAMLSIGGILSSLGLEETGEVLSEIGGWISVIGGAVAAIGPIVSVVGAIIAKWGVTCSLAWLWVTLIAVAIAGLIALVVILAKRESAAEKKLNSATAAAEKAAEAADKAAEAYNTLNQALDDLSGKYDALDELTAGTEEWKKQVEEINSSVLDLITQYPELYELMNKDGPLLKLDVESDEVQNVLKQYEGVKLEAQAAKMFADADLVKAQAEKALYDFSEEFTINWELEGDVNTIFEDLKKQNAKLAESERKTETELLSMAKMVSQASTKVESAFFVASQAALKLADMEGWTDEEKNMASNTAGSAKLTEALKKQMEEEYGDINFLEDNDGSESLSEEHKALLEAAIKAKYGEGATFNYDGSGEILVNGVSQGDFSNDELLGIVASHATTQKQAEAVEYSKEANNAMIEMAEEKGLGSAMSKLLQGKTEELSIDELQELSKLDLKKMWEDENVKKAYADNYEVFEKVIGGMEEDAEDIGEDVKKKIEKYSKTLAENTTQLSIGAQKKLLEKLEKMSKTSVKDSGLEENLQKILGEDDEQNEKIVEMITSADWETTEDLEKLQGQLIQTFGLDDSVVKEMISSLGQAANAVSYFDTHLRLFDDFYIASNNLSTAIKKVTDAQEEYQHALEMGDLEGAKIAMRGLGEYTKEAFALSNQVKELGFLQMLEYQVKNGSDKNLSIVDANGATKLFSDLVTYNAELNAWSAITGNEIFEKKLLTDSDYSEKFYEYLDGLNEHAEKLNETEESQEELLDTIKNYEAEGRDAYNELFDKVKEALVSEQQEEIDTQQELLDLEREYNNQILSTMQEQLSEQRRIRELNEQEQGLTDLYSQQAYLGMDTSGANALQQLQLQEQIKDQEQQLQDTLIDQSLDQLSLDNEKAAEQRERQIAIQQSQLDTYMQSAEFLSQVRDNINVLTTSGKDWLNTEIGQKIFNLETKEQALSEAEIEAIKADIGGKITLVDEWLTNTTSGFFGSYVSKLSEALGFSSTDTSLYDSLTAGFGGIVGANKDVGGVGEGVSLKDLNNTIANKQTNAKAELLSTDIAALGDQGFDTGALAFEYDENGNVTNYKDIKTKVENLKAFTEKEGNLREAGSFEKKEDKIRKYMAVSGSEDQVYLSKEEYYKGMQSQIAHGVDVEDYETYIKRVTSEQRQKFKDVRETRYDEIPLEIEKAAKEGNRERVETLIEEYANIGRDASYMIWRRIGDDLTNYPYYLEYARQVDHGIYRHLEPISYSLLEQITGYKTGGLADFTGPAWLDGTPSKPEYILNAKQTERFFSLIDVLENVDKKDTSTKQTGDNYFDIDINVEKLDNDYDVEQVANKIRKMLYDDASYRNVNTINSVR